MVVLVVVPGMAMGEMVDLTAENGWQDLVTWNYIQYPGDYQNMSVASTSWSMAFGEFSAPSLSPPNPPTGKWHGAILDAGGALEGWANEDLDAALEQAFFAFSFTQDTGPLGFQPNEAVGSWMISLDMDGDGIGQFDRHADPEDYQWFSWGPDCIAFGGGTMGIPYDDVWPSTITLLTPAYDPVPEPASCVMLVIGGLALVRRTRNALRRRVS